MTKVFGWLAGKGWFGYVVLGLLLALVTVFFLWRGAARDKAILTAKLAIVRNQAERANRLMQAQIAKAERDARSEAVRDAAIDGARREHRKEMIKAELREADLRKEAKEKGLADWFNDRIDEHGSLKEGA